MFFHPLLLIFLVVAQPPAPWRHPLYLGNGEPWSRRVPIVVTNSSDRPIAGATVALKIGRGDGEADLVGADATALRVCNEKGDEMLFLVTAADGSSVPVGPIPAGAMLSIPVECAAHSQARYYAHFDNPRAWQVPEFWTSTGALQNGGMEEGEGDAPRGWRHDDGDQKHRALWCSDTSHTGRRCLKTVVEPGAEPSWISTRQGNLRIVGGARYTMTAWVKAQDVVGEAGWYIHVGNAQNSMISSPMLLGGGGTYDWKQVRAEFTAPPDADVADLGTVLRGTGTAWFDDVALTCEGGDARITARADPAERLQVRREGATRTWWRDPARPAVRWDYRAPIQVANLSDDDRSRTLTCVDLTPALGRLRGKALPETLRVVFEGRPVRHYRLGDSLLIEGGAPAHTIRTYSALFSSDHRALNAAGRAGRTGRTAANLAPNPALPGGDTRGARSINLGDYAALLASPRNLVRNGSFEAGQDLPDDWPGGAEGERPAGAEMGLAPGGLFGAKCVRLHVPERAARAWVGWRQDVAVRPGHSYLLAAWLKCKDISGDLQLYVHLLTRAGAPVREGAYTGTGPALSGTQDWTLLSGIFTVPADCERFQIHLTMLASGTVWHDGIVLLDVTPAETEGLEPRPSAGASLAVWPVNAIVKVFREDVPPARVRPARITCARNEYEPLQLAVRSDRSLGAVRILVDAPRGPRGFVLKNPSVSVVGYVPIDHVTNYYSNRTPAYYRKIPTGAGGSDGWPGWWPDPLLPRSSFELAARRTQPVWVTVRAPEDAPAGDYHGAVRLMAGDKTLAVVPFTVHVWGFSLPAQPSLKAIFDTRQSSPMWRVPGRSEQQTQEAFWRFLAERRLCPDQVQPEPTFVYRDGKVTADFTEYDRAAKLYFDELKFPHSYTPSQFYLFGWGHIPADKFGEKPYEGEYPYTGVDRSKLRPAYRRAFQACLKAYWEHVKEKGWADRITFYIADEPYDVQPEIRAQMKALCDMVHEVDPHIPIYSSTWHHQPEWDGYLNVWGFGHYGIVSVAKMEEVKRGGATIWWTTDGQMCTDTPYCAIERLLPHYCMKYGAKAYEFWGVDWLTFDPYRYGWHAFLLHDFGPGQEKEWVRYPNGDGFLAYPPAPLKLDRAVASVRLEQAREGVEDYEYLLLLQRLVQKARAVGRNAGPGERALARAAALVTSPCEIGRYSTRILPDPDRVLQVKEAVAQAIETLSGGK